MKWYTTTKPDDMQGLVYDEETGKNIAVTYNPKDARLIAAAPELLETLRAAKVVAAISYNSLKEDGVVDGAIYSVMARLEDAYNFIDSAIRKVEEG